ncbi:hypothetical protein BS78_06G049700 [Paspalum vaginatum]|nr:hypothetical protein BS78_06G049700 [Paspalum vaginatum]
MHRAPLASSGLIAGSDPPPAQIYNCQNLSAAMAISIGSSIRSGSHGEEGPCRRPRGDPSLSSVGPLPHHNRPDSLALACPRPAPCDPRPRAVKSSLPQGCAHGSPSIVPSAGQRSHRAPLPLGRRVPCRTVPSLAHPPHRHPSHPSLCLQVTKETQRQ